MNPTSEPDQEEPGAMQQPVVVSSHSIVFRILFNAIVVVFLLSGWDAFTQNQVGIGSETVIDLPVDITIPVELSVDTDLSLLSVGIHFDPRLLQTDQARITPMTDRFTEGAADNITVSVDKVTGEISWTALDFSGGTIINAGSGELFTIGFTINEALSGKSTAITLDSVSAVDGQLNAVFVTPAGGTVTSPSDAISIGAINALTTPGVVETTVDLDTGIELNFLGFELTFDPDLLEISNENVVSAVERFAAAVNITTSVDNDAGRLVVSISENDNEAEIDFLGGVAVLAGSGPIFSFHFSVEDDRDCVTSALQLKDVVGFDTALAPANLGVQDGESQRVEFTIDNPSKGCITLDRSSYSCTDVVEVELRDLDLRAEVLLEYTFEGENPGRNSGILGSAYDLTVSGEDVFVASGFQSRNSLFFDDPKDFAEVLEPLTIPGDAGRLELRYKPVNDSVMRDNYLFSTGRSSDKSDGVRHALRYRFRSDLSPARNEVDFHEESNVQNLQGVVDLAPDEDNDKWYHIEFSWWPGSCTLSVDGTVVIGSTECTFMRFTDIAGFAIGGDWGSTGDNSMRGFIDDMRLYRVGPAPVDIVIGGENSDREVLSLREIDAETGVFRGSISTSNTAERVEGDGVLTVSDSDTITVTYNDADDGTGSSVTTAESALIDCVAPTITVPAEPITVSIGSAPPDLLAGVVVDDTVDGDIVERIVIGGDTVDPNVPGEAVVTYRVVDKAGNSAEEKTVVFNVIDDALRIVVDEASVAIGEGEDATVNVRLNGAPADELIISGSRISGDSDITLASGRELIFTPENWEQEQALVLSAAEDDGDTLNGSAVVLLRKKSGSNRVLQQTITASEDDNDITLTVIAEGMGRTEPEGALVVDTNTMPFPVEAIAEAGGEFIEWRGESDIIEDSQSLVTTITANRDSIITAVFTTSNPSPVVTIISPSTNDVFTAPAVIPVTMEASDNGGSITKIELFANGINVGETVNDPYQIRWQVDTPDDYVLTAVATSDSMTKAISPAISVQVTDFFFRFVRPNSEENSVLHSDEFTFVWELSSDIADFNFDLYLFETNQIEIHQLGSAEKLNPTPLNSNLFNHRFGYVQRGGFPFDPIAGESTWYPFVLIRDGAHEGEIYFSEQTLTVRGRENVTVEIVQPQEDDAIELGQFLPVKAVLRSEKSGNLTGAAIIRLRDCQGTTVREFRDLVRDGLLEIVLQNQNAPNFSQSWEVEVAWPQDDQYEGGSDGTCFQVAPTKASLELINLGATHVTGVGLTISGELTLFNQNPGSIPLSEFDIELVVRHPAASTTGAETIVPLGPNSDGAFKHEFASGFFDIQGDWEIEARCSDLADFTECASFVGNLAVRDKRGYAILQLGSVSGQGTSGDEPEGLSEHRNTLTFVQEQMLESGIIGEDINFLESGGNNPQEQLRIAIEEWARDKLLEAPAPLYLVLAGHGNPEQFHHHPDILEPGELNTMIANLEGAIADNTLAAGEKIVVILGMCYSGSFINALSAPGRVIVTTAAANERSIRGPGQPEDRQGEYFVYLLFREFGKGLSLLRSFTLSRDIIRVATSNFDLTIDGLGQSFPDRLGQHPLLDDNGDGKGSFDFPFGTGDGDLARNIFLIGGREVDPLEIRRTSPTIFLTADDPFPELFAEIDDDQSSENTPVIFMEVKIPNSETADLEGSLSMQAGLNLVRQDMERDDAVTDRMLYKWPRSTDPPNPDNLFLNPGLYEVFFNAISTAEGIERPSIPGVSRVYRASGGTPPSDFRLISPENHAVIDFATSGSAGIFSWSESVCRLENDGCRVDYIFRLWNHPTNRTADNLVFESTPLRTTFAFFTPAQLASGTFWWNVVAVDSLGNFSESSELFRVTVLPTNVTLPGRIVGRVFEKNSRQGIRGGVIRIQGRENKAATVVNGEYFVLLRPDRGYKITADVSGYQELLFDELEINPNGEIEINFPMTIGISVNPGWNLVSTPMDLMSAAIEDQLTISGEDAGTSRIRTVWKWSSQNFNRAKQLESGDGYWLWSTDSGFLETNGAVPQPNTLYRKGWNLVGIKGVNAIAPPVNSDIIGIIWGWDGQNRVYSPINIGSMPEQDQEKLIPGKGYWIYLRDDRELRLSSTPVN